MALTVAQICFERVPPAECFVFLQEQWTLRQSLPTAAFNHPTDHPQGGERIDPG